MIALEKQVKREGFPSFSTALEARFSDSSGTFAQKLSNLDVINRDGAGAQIGNNETAAQAEWFDDPESGDLHLTSSAAGAIDQGEALEEVGGDIDGEQRDPAPDLEADEIVE
ncbi:MAG: hypothetical protein R6V85_04850 [Polyangia bacterium]